MYQTDSEGRVASYVRVSTLEQTRGVSLEAQLEKLRNFAKFKGWAITAEYKDGGYSGKDGDRPGLKQMLAEAGRGNLSTIMVTKIDRLMRTPGCSSNWWTG